MRAYWSHRSSSTLLYPRHKGKPRKIERAYAEVNEVNRFFKSILDFPKKDIYKCPFSKKKFLDLKKTSTSSLRA